MENSLIVQEGRGMVECWLKLVMRIKSYTCHNENRVKYGSVDLKVI